MNKANDDVLLFGKAKSSEDDLGKPKKKKKMTKTAPGPQQALNNLRNEVQVSRYRTYQGYKKW